MSRQYYGIENLALTNDQRNTLADALKQLGDNQHPNPAYRNHIRIRLDNQAIIFEARFNDEDWTLDMMINRLANLFGVNPNVISANVNQTQYGPVVTFSAGGTDYLRMVAFGGLLANYAESHAAVLQYLSNNIVEWEEPLEQTFNLFGEYANTAPTVTALGKTLPAYTTKVGKFIWEKVLRQ